MSKRLSNKERERHFVEVFKSVFKEFPAGEILADEEQERPDVIVLNAHGKIGIEVTRILHESLKRDESESEAAVSEARRIYEKSDLPNLHVSVNFGVEKPFSRRTRTTFATTLAKLVAANVPSVNSYVELENDWENPKNFPFEIDSVYILRNSALTRNHWSSPSGGVFRENFTRELQEVILDKESRLSGYSTCATHWLLVVAENSSPSAFFDPSATTLNHLYKSTFNRIFFLDLFLRKVYELKLIAP
jgi:hypothetical protein